MYSSEDLLQYIDWGFGSPLPIVYLKRLDEYNGRVKWWRKKVREGFCPPILTWLQDNLQAHFLIDGQARLQACLLENVEPTVLTITNTYTRSYEIKEEKREELQRIIDKNSDKMPTDVLNNMLIDRHSPKQTLERTALYSTAVKNFDPRWLHEVYELVKSHPVDDDELQSMINGN